MTTVWIIGAGFSRPLGGPLLAGFFSTRVFDSACAWLAELGRPETEIQFHLVKNLYLYGAREDCWANVEEFLADVTSAASDHATENRLQRYLGRLEEIKLGQFSMQPATLKPSHVVGWSLQYVAAAVAHFVPDTLSTREDEVPETWAPYTAWFDALGADHAIVSFNYDRVIEVLAERRRSVCGRDVTLPPILHLHGMVPENREIVASIQTGAAIDGIALPGRLKKDAIVRRLQEPWSAAERLLRDADEIIVVGYSLPRTDTYTRQRIQRVLATRENGGLTIRTVMGRDNADIEHIRRALSMRVVTWHDEASYVEEYFTAVTAAGKLELPAIPGEISVVAPWIGTRD